MEMDIADYAYRLMELIWEGETEKVLELAKEGKLGVKSLYFQDVLSKKQYDLALRWIEALRSGEFEQGTNCLADEEEPGRMCYCCLGVANHVFGLGVPEDEGGLYFEDENGTTFRRYEELGLRTKFGGCDPEETYWFYPTDVSRYHRQEFITLAGLNDELLLSFSQIADLLEASLTLVEVKG